MELYLVRHAIAHDRDPEQWPDDSARPLTADGERRFTAAARGLGRLIPTVNVVLSSRFARAWRTAELLHEHAGWPEPRACAELESGQPAAAALAPMVQHQLESAVAVVGHEPHLGELASLLLAGDPERLVLDLKKGGAVCLDLDTGVSPGTATLRWALTPKILRQLGAARGKH